jgi:cyclopropane fatty-acyl-phospholipid synthase-like methyltransferase
MNDFKQLYESEYFKERFNGVDLKREKSYLQEYERITQFVTGGKVLDIGCGMGNFLEIFDKSFDKYGLEISEFAKKEAQKKGIKIIDYDFKKEFFDIIIFRGVFQHLDTPLYDLQRASELLKKNGLMIFLATPNSNSPYYKCFNTLPMLDSTRNFVIPSDTMLTQILKNFNFKIEKIVYPYIDSPYAQPFKDHGKFILNLFGFKYKFAFWKNMMEIYARKIK